MDNIAQFFHFEAEEKKRRQKTKAFYEWATTGIPVKNKEENTVTYQESPPWLLTMFKTPCVETILYPEFSRSNRQENISGRTMDAGNHRLLLTSSGDAISEAFVEGRTHKFIVQRLNSK